MNAQGRFQRSIWSSAEVNSSVSDRRFGRLVRMSVAGELGDALGRFSAGSDVRSDAAEAEEGTVLVAPGRRRYFPPALLARDQDGKHDIAERGMAGEAVGQRLARGIAAAILGRGRREQIEQRLAVELIAGEADHAGQRRRDVLEAPFRVRLPEPVGAFMLMLLEQETDDFLLLGELVAGAELLAELVALAQAGDEQEQRVGRHDRGQQGIALARDHHRDRGEAHRQHEAGRGERRRMEGNGDRRHEAAGQRPERDDLDRIGVLHEEKRGRGPDEAEQQAEHAMVEDAAARDAAEAGARAVALQAQQRQPDAQREDGPDEQRQRRDMAQAEQVGKDHGDHRDRRANGGHAIGRAQLGTPDKFRSIARKRPQTHEGSERNRLGPGPGSPEQW